MSRTISHGRERGVALFIVLVFLVVLTLLGVTAIQGSSMGEKLARNELDHNLAMQAAESGLRDAELDLRTMRADGTQCVPGSTGCRSAPERQGGVRYGLSTFATDCARGQCGQQVFDPPVTDVATLWTNTSDSVTSADNFTGAVPYGLFTGATALPGVARQPVYLIETVTLTNSYLSGGFVFRVTAIGFGASASTAVMLQAIYKFDGSIGT